MPVAYVCTIFNKLYVCFRGEKMLVVNTDEASNLVVPDYSCIWNMKLDVGKMLQMTLCSHRTKRTLNHLERAWIANQYRIFYLLRNSWYQHCDTSMVGLWTFPRKKNKQKTSKRFFPGFNVLLHIQLAENFLLFLFFFLKSIFSDPRREARKPKFDRIHFKEKTNNFVQVEVRHSHHLQSPGTPQPFQCAVGGFDFVPLRWLKSNFFVCLATVARKEKFKK